MNVTLSNLAQLTLHAACCALLSMQVDGSPAVAAAVLCVLSINALYAGLRNGVQIGWEARNR